MDKIEYCKYINIIQTPTFVYHTRLATYSHIFIPAHTCTYSHPHSHTPPTRSYPTLEKPSPQTSLVSVYPRTSHVLVHSHTHTYTRTHSRTHIRIHYTHPHTHTQETPSPTDFPRLGVPTYKLCTRTPVLITLRAPVTTEMTSLTTLQATKA